MGKLPSAHVPGVPGGNLLGSCLTAVLKTGLPLQVQETPVVDEKKAKKAKKSKKDAPGNDSDASEQVRRLP